jgi:hypothetical protein
VTRDARRRHEVADVALDESLAERIFEGMVEDDVELADSRWGETLGELTCVEGFDLGGESLVRAILPMVGIACSVSSSR